MTILGRDVSISDFDQAVSSALAEWGIPGATVGVSVNGETFTRAYGAANLETGQPVLPESIFRLASISKPFTATLAMTLVEEGTLDLEAPIVEYVPQLALADQAARANVTMRHLLSHRGGFDGEFQTSLAEYGDADSALSQLPADYGVLRQWTKPGELLSYCNTGFWLAGAAIAAITGQTFEQAMRERVFEPLGLESTCYTAEEAIVHPIALGHNPISPTSNEHRLFKSFAYPRVRRPSGGVISNVQDVLTFANAHLDLGTVSFLSEASRAAMQSPAVTLRESAADWWGIGFAGHDYPGGRTFGHGGSYGGYQTDLQIAPDATFACIILTNSSRGSAAIPAIRTYLLKTFAGIETPDPELIALPEAQLQALAGHYVNPANEIDATITVQGDRLEMQMAEPAGQPPVLLGPTSEREFVALNGASKGSRVDFIDRNGETAHFARIALRICERA